MIILSYNYNYLTIVIIIIIYDIYLRFISNLKINDTRLLNFIYIIS